MSSCRKPLPPLATVCKRARTEASSATEGVFCLSSLSPLCGALVRKDLPTPEETPRADLGCDGGSDGCNSGDGNEALQEDSEPEECRRCGGLLDRDAYCRSCVDAGYAHARSHGQALDLDPSCSDGSGGGSDQQGTTRPVVDLDPSCSDGNDGGSDDDSGWGTEALPGPARIAARARLWDEKQALEASNAVVKAWTEREWELTERHFADIVFRSPSRPPMRDPTYESPLPAGWTPPRTPEGWCPETEAELSRELTAFLGRRSRGARVSTGPTTASHVGARS